ncbi:group XIIA secretory phospholipase A2 isoform X1 [Caretta caretta]|uniref:group XIIA secretory phospholipase A2 isoform X1 n=1 Tax=Caretta caretta TaxID=8467 RepID=UPI003F4C7128
MACALLLLACGLLGQCQQEPQTPDWRMTLKTIRNGVHKIDMYLNAALDLLGGEDGLCLYKCSDGSKPLPRYGYKLSPPNGCGSPLFGVHFDIGIPSMTKCCNQHDRCYDTCGNRKNDCDEQFQYCLSKICREVQKTLGISESVQGSILLGFWQFSLVPLCFLIFKREPTRNRRRGGSARKNHLKNLDVSHQPLLSFPSSSAQISFITQP